MAFDPIDARGAGQTLGQFDRDRRGEPNFYAAMIPTGGQTG